ncbi:MAG TPA: hypothetical protein PK880_10370 [Candidatus Competibacter sp.]|nr:hypothetical protein [Candidatus Competibacter sp.]
MKFHDRSPLSSGRAPVSWLAKFRFEKMMVRLIEQQSTRQHFPERLESVEHGPQTPGGKLQKPALRAMAEAFGDGSQTRTGSETAF